MPLRTALIAAADSKYFDFLLEMIGSFRALADAPELDLCILDVGLEPGQIAQLRGMVKRIVTATWDLDFPGRERAPTWFKAMVSRPHLPRHFPDYDQLAWVDADTWFANSQALQLLLRGAATGQICIVAELDRAYDNCFQRRPGALEFMFNCFQAAWGADAARKFAALPVINSGFFAMRSDCPNWKIWSDTLNEALQRASYLMIEQCALNVAIYTGKIVAHLLPSWCNWKCVEALPILDPQSRELYCPMLPHERISLCHLIAIKRDPVPLRCTDGTLGKMPLTWTSIHADQLPEPITT